MDQAKLSEARQLMIKLINDNFPNVDTRKGTVVHDLLVSIAAIGYATISEDIDNFEDKMYLSQIIEDPDSVDESTVDGILSNLYVNRKAGSKAIGLVKVEVSEQRDYFISKGSLFKTAEELSFYVTQDYSISLENLYQQDGNYYFFVEVQAAEEGSLYTVAETTSLTTTILAGSLVSAEAFNDFQNGIDRESNQALIERAPTALGARALSHRQSIQTILQEQFQDIRQITTIGYNDREMQRDLNNAGFKVGGKIDVFVRSSSQPLTKTLEKTVDSNGKITIADDEVPVLRVKNLALANSPANTTEDFQINILGNNDPQFYRFSSYEQLEVETPYNPGDNIIATVDYMPLINEIQEYVDQDEVKYLRSDTLVRSYMPCFVSMIVEYKSNFPSADTESAIRQALLNYINTYNEDVLYVSKLIDVLHNIDIINILLPLEITGEFHLPDGGITTVASENELKIESDFSLGISEKTYRFFSTPSDIGMNKNV